MWFEGESEVTQFPAKLRTILETVPQGQTEPMWKMISSNVGTSVAEDGYVFHSKGKTGNDNIYIGFNLGFIGNSTANWWHGNRFFVAESYTPSLTPNTNGVFGRCMYEYPKYNYARIGAGLGDTADLGMVIRYKVSVNKDRVILIVENQVAVSTSYATNVVLYLGLMKRYSNETDSTGVVLACNYGYSFNQYNQIRVLRDRQRIFESVYEPRYMNHLALQGMRGYGRKFFATTIPLHKGNEGFRGELDGMLAGIYSNHTSTMGRTCPERGYVKINGKEYYCVVKNYYHLSNHDNFAPSTEHYAYFIEKG